MKRKVGINKTVLRDPDAIEITLVGILTIWTISAFLLLYKASTLGSPNLISWTSLTAFFSGFSSIVLIVIAIIIADMRKEIVK